jgi:hypothetical protein
VSASVADRADKPPLLVRDDRSTPQVRLENIVHERFRLIERHPELARRNEQKKRLHLAVQFLGTRLSRARTAWLGLGHG